MKTLIIYNSLTGFTEKYALALGERLGENAEVVPLKKFKVKMLDGCDKAVFMSRVVNNAIAGFKTVVKYAKKFAEKYTAIVAVGMAEPNAAQYHALEEANIPYLLKGIPLFVLRGGFDAEKLKGKDKLMIKFTCSRLEKAPSRTREEMALLNFFAAKTDKSDLSTLAPIEEYLSSGIFTPPEKTDEQPPFWMNYEEFMEEEEESEPEEVAPVGDKNQCENS